MNCSIFQTGNVLSPPPVAKAIVLSETEVHFCQHAADFIQTKGQTITKTTVMNKVHAIEKEILRMEEVPVEKKVCEYLHIEADEDHIHRKKMEKNRNVSWGNMSIFLKGKKRSVKTGGN